ncbi:phosphoribosylaminoimidazolesuccinocarboxamide synthase [Staphylococcus aureus]
MINFKIEFGKTETGQILLADEISPDTCDLNVRLTMQTLIKMYIEITLDH